MAEALRSLRPLWRLLRWMRLLSVPPGWLAEHARAYGELAGLELASEWAWWRRGLLLNVLGWLGLAMALGLTGVALMLWAVVPAAQVHAPWMLWLVPLALALPALACLWLAGIDRDRPFLSRLRRQVQADLALCRPAGERAQP
ncbi:MAG: hypothetical protein ACOVOG_08460 [Rubrivivax sp.]